MAPPRLKKVPLLIDLLGAIAQRGIGFQKRLGNFETRMLAEDIVDMKITEPVFITGLARSGSTLLLEIIARRPGFAAHAYRDYPFLFTPVFWNTVLDFWPGMKGQELKQRAHKDGILVNADSPEAFDEILWNAFFDRLHDPSQDNRLGADAPDGGFLAFYRDHVRKLLFLRKGRRFVSKNNYNVTRLGCLRRAFPDAKFVLPVRDPVTHVFSLLKQHRLFSKEQEADPRALRYMQRCGHYEFGLDFRPVNTGDGAAARVLEFWHGGSFAKAYAVYWRSIHAHLLREMEQAPGATHVVLYDKLCSEPAAQLSKLSEFCRLGMAKDEVARAASPISAPSYYTRDLGEDEVMFINKECAEIYKEIAARA